MFTFSKTLVSISQNINVIGPTSWLPPLRSWLQKQSASVLPTLLISIMNKFQWDLICTYWPCLLQSIFFFKIFFILHKVCNTFQQQLENAKPLEVCFGLQTQIFWVCTLLLQPSMHPSSSWQSKALSNGLILGEKVRLKSCDENHSK